MRKGNIINIYIRMLVKNYYYVLYKYLKSEVFCINITYLRIYKYF
jgi:hypothetical protein